MTFVSKGLSETFLAVGMAICVLFGVPGKAAEPDSPPMLQPDVQRELPCASGPPQMFAFGQKLERDLGGGECHSYEVALFANQFLRVAVEQKGIDVVLTIYGTDRAMLSKVDRPNGSRGTETLSLIAPVTGLYILNVRSLESVSARGPYTLTISHPRANADRDATQIAAEQLVSEGERLRSQGNAKSVRSAIEKFQHAAEVWRSLKNDYEEALALYGAGISSTSLGDNQAGIDYLKRALPMFVQLQSVSGEAMVRAGLGWPYLYLADIDSAFDSFNLAFELHRSQGNIRGEGISLYGMGWVHAVRGENQKALQKFRESLSRRRTTLDRRGEALTLTGMGKIEGRLGDHVKALSSLNLALEVLPKPHDRHAEADILSNLGWVHNAQKEDNKAIKFFNSALTLRRELGDSIGEATTLYGMSIIHRRTGLFAEAQFEIEDALKIIESLRAKGTNYELRISYFASVQDYYEFYIALLLELDRQQPLAGYAAKAVHACERARARGLLDLLAEAKVDLRQGVDPSLLDRERFLSKKITAGWRQRQSPDHKNGGPALETPAKEIHDLGSELEAVRGQIRTLNPRYAALLQPQPLTAPEIQKQILDENTLLLLYVLGSEKSFLLAVSPQEIASYELPARAQIEGLARRFYDATTIRNQPRAGESARTVLARIAQGDEDGDRLAHDLSQILLGPAINQLKQQRLIVVAPGALQFIPFAALPSPSKASNDLKLKNAQLPERSASVESHPLIEEHEIVVLPSVTALSVMRAEVKTRRPQSKAVVVLADPVFDASDARIRRESIASRESPHYRSASHAQRPSLAQGSTVAESNGKFARLTSSRWEGEKILSLVPEGEGKLVVDFAANRAFVTSPELGTYRVIHFATHAVIDFQHPGLSGIVLSMVDHEGRHQDAFLGLDDIFKLKLPVELVVLSGCRTALGTDHAGEGLVGLTRGFMYAGAPRVAVSLWQVADKPTSELMVRFYKHMLGPGKMRPAAALRAAQLDLRKDPRWRAPYFWAPFVLQGEWR